MGKIYTPEEVRLGRLPEPDAPLNMARAAIARYRAENEMRGHPTLTAMVFGAAVLEQTNSIRTEVNIVVRPSAEQNDELLRSVEKEAEEQHVSLRHFILPPDNDSALLDPFLARHLTELHDVLYEKHDDLIEGNPVFDFLAYVEQARDDPTFQLAAALRCLGARALEFQSAKQSSQEIDWRTYQRALELPDTLARQLPDHVLGRCTREEALVSIRQWMIERAVSARMQAHFQQVAIFDVAYDTILRTTTAHPDLLGVYTRWVRKNYVFALKLAHIFTLEWVDEITKFYQENYSIDQQRLAELQGVIELWD